MAEETCTWVEDCSARDAAIAAAQAALDSATIALDNANELLGNIEAEQNTVNNMISNYDSVYSALVTAGPTFCTEANCGYLSSGCGCIESYASDLSAAHSSAQAEVSRCQAAYDQAVNDLATAQATPCDQKCV